MNDRSSKRFWTSGVNAGSSAKSLKPALASRSFRTSSILALPPSLPPRERYDQVRGSMSRLSQQEVSGVTAARKNRTHQNPSSQMSLRQPGTSPCWQAEAKESSHDCATWTAFVELASSDALGACVGRAPSTWGAILLGAVWERGKRDRFVLEPSSAGKEEGLVTRPVLTCVCPNRRTWIKRLYRPL